MVKWTHKTSTVSAILASALLTLSLGACAGGQGQSSQQSSEQLSEQPAEQADSQAADQGPIDTSGGSPWIDSNIKDNIKPNMKTSPKDDYYLYANYDWLLNTDIPEGDRLPRALPVAHADGSRLRGGIQPYTYQGVHERLLQGCHRSP